MKRSLLVLLALSALPYTQAQSSYFGLHVDVIAGPASGSVAPLGGLQLGGPILDDVELRVSFLPLLLFNLLQVDVLYTQDLSNTLRGYGGVGGDAVLVAFYEDGLALGVHVTAGLEYGLGSGIGLFGEVQPLYILKTPEPTLGGFLGKLNLGINFHF